MAPLLLFCSDPRSPRRPDETFAHEVEAAERAGFGWSLVDLQALAAGEGERAVRMVPSGNGEELIYRGWMLRPAEYGRLCAELVQKGLAPVNDQEAYAEAHLLPLAYRHIQGETAESVWTEGVDLDRAFEAARSLAPGPIMVKDYVKSAKHRFREACFIADPTDREAVVSTCQALLEDRGERLEGGLVFRRWLPLRERGTSMLGAPIHDETRLFFYDQKPLCPPSTELDIGHYAAVAARFRSRFLTIDVALGDDGRHWIVETGDGGVSGVPPAMDDLAFYQALFAASSAKGHR